MADPAVATVTAPELHALVGG
ncbi:hypothetical protein FRACA_380028 [Frankia canadensis]|uniref:Uncharacterized protein n=1 Tax=Frankia canadensis TaxID=1836972 RepID=A0A2I2KVY7_9ACTN|nr:hypothetical protein FRACA_380028 [Frankia canadensis]SOU57127.1 hypothetical protein FRACA_380028 [Frankia canadensis]